MENPAMKANIVSDTHVIEQRKQALENEFQRKYQQVLSGTDQAEIRRVRKLMRKEVRAKLWEEIREKKPSFMSYLLYRVLIH
jgi:hypothetical protein